jgi:hypothetical protein
MRKRLEAIGGQFEIASRQRQGTKIRMTIPLKPGYMPPLVAADVRRL